jgi:hypothetical protein
MRTTTMSICALVRAWFGARLPEGNYASASAVLAAIE